MTIKAFYDGKVIVPEEPLDVEPNRRLVLTVGLEDGLTPPAGFSALDWLIENSVKEDILPHDLGYQHDHYLYGTPKKDAP